VSELFKKPLPKPTKIKFNVNWENGIIGRVEEFIIRRHKVNPIIARTCGTVIVSSMLKQTILTNGIGKVNAGESVMLIGRTGCGKSPVMERVRDYVNTYDHDRLIPERFTLEGLTERLDEQDHPKNYVIVNDEVSMMVAEKTKKHFSGVFEFQSKAWDGWVFGSLTRKYKSEGGFRCSSTFFGGGTEVFFDDLNDTFFTQGLAPRFLWIYFDYVEPERRPDDFLLKGNMGDQEWESLKSWIQAHSYTLGSARISSVCDIAANDLWLQKDLEWRKKAESSIDVIEGGMYAKLSIHSLKLAQCYAASRLSIDTKSKKGQPIVEIYEQDMKRAMSDIEIYIQEHGKIINLWRTKEKSQSDKRGTTNVEQEQQNQ